MRLLRIQVPDFRVLKNVDINFEKEFVPSIFPIGSQNGGGKSTLLQLIFVLLHCSNHSDRTEYLQNMLNGFTIQDESGKRILAIIDIWDGERIVKLEFLSYKDSSIKEILDDFYANDNPNNDAYLNLSFSAFPKLQSLKNDTVYAEAEVKKLDRLISQLEEIKKIKNADIRRSRFREIVDGDLVLVMRQRLTKTPSLLDEFEAYLEFTQRRLDEAKLNLEAFDKERLRLEHIFELVSKCLLSENLLYICNYANSNKVDEFALLCHIENIDMDKAGYFFEEISRKIYLAAPATQVFLFLPQESRKLLFREQKKESDYDLQMKFIKSKLTGFFTYDFLAVDLLIEAFKASRDKDFREAIEKGEYGNSYKELMTDLDTILLNKRIKLDADFAGITFQLNKDGENIELYPEDLSHGELKRLSIYMWIRYHNIEDAIVLMDEIEIAFHPDWQYQIVSDLQQWSKSNQYILATHSYELCQALTPSHVKELEPKLLRQ